MFELPPMTVMLHTNEIWKSFVLAIHSLVASLLKASNSPSGRSEIHSTMPIRFAMDEDASEEEYNVEEPTHSLPESAEDMKISAGRAVGDQKRRKRNLIIAGISAAVVIFIISISVSISKSKNPQESPRMQQTKSFLSLVTDTSALRDHTSPQYAAANWLANMDATEIPQEPGNGDGKLFLQRYALAVLYYALKGEHWVFDSRFLNKDPECAWVQQFTTQDGKFDMGVKCNDVNHVKELRLRKWRLSVIK